MIRTTSVKRMLLAGIATAATAGALVAPAAQAAHDPSAVPAAIGVEAGNKLFLTTHATGVQIYSCNATAAGSSWTFVAPRADLYGHNGKLIGTHFAGPTWEARDGSQVVARRVDGVTVDPTAIDWLLLSATSTTAGADGDRLTRTTYIQRVDTIGGLAPAPATCNAGTIGAVAEVPYTADYRFWKSTGK